jgi:hypothetical protein
VRLEVPLFLKTFDTATFITRVARISADWSLKRGAVLLEAPICAPVVALAIGATLSVQTDGEGIEVAHRQRPPVNLAYAGIATEMQDAPLSAVGARKKLTFAV